MKHYLFTILASMFYFESNAQFEYYGLWWDASTSIEYFVEYDPITNTKTNISSVPDVAWIGGKVAINQDSGWYAFQGSESTGPQRHYVIDISTGNLISNTIITENVNNIEYFTCSQTSSTDVIISCNSYTWIDGNTYTSSNNSATFNIIGGSANGCDSIVTLDLTINSVSDITTTTSGTTISATNIVATYQWLDCDYSNATVNGETGQSYNTTMNGSYAVELSENGCLDTSACVAIITVGIVENSFEHKLTVYPNPTSGNFSIDLGAIYESSTVSMTDISCKFIDSETISKSQVLNLNIKEPAGIYIVSIQAGDKKAVIRLIKE